MTIFRKILFHLGKTNVKRFHLKTNRRFFSSSLNILDSGLPDVLIPRTSISEYVFDKGEKYDRFIAAECSVTGRKYTYGELIQKSKNFGKNFRKRLNLQDGDTIAIFLPNILEYPLVMLGAQHANLIVTTINPAYTCEEISRQLADSSAKAIVTLVGLTQNAKASSRLLKKDLPIVAIKTEQAESIPLETIDFFELLDKVDYPDLCPRKPEDVAVLPYSSGTTGFPKGVQLTNFNVVANICQTTSPDLGLFEETTSTHQDVVPVFLPMFHIYGLVLKTLVSLTKGVKLVYMPKFTPEGFLIMLRIHKPQVLFLVPPTVLFLSASPMVKQADLQSVRTTFCGAAPLGALDEEKFLEKAGKNINMLQVYGLTEASPLVTVLTPKVKSETNVTAAIGCPLPNTLVKIVNPDDATETPLGSNSIGELWVKGPQVMKGYLNKPEETKNIIVNDGWLRTGDIVYYNDDKVLFVTDRLKELIKVKGFQVAPAELEEIIRDFPNVEDAAVVGVPHERHGEVPRAFVSLKKGTNANIKELEEYVKGKVADYKQLKGGVIIVDSIPKNPSGKTLRRLLKNYKEK